MRNKDEFCIVIFSSHQNSQILTRFCAKNFIRKKARWPRTMYIKIIKRRKNPQNSLLYMSIFNFSANNFYKECATEQAIFFSSGTGISSG